MFRERLHSKRFIIGGGLALMICGAVTLFANFLFLLPAAALFSALIMLALNIFFVFHLRIHHEYEVGGEHPLEDGYFLVSCILFVVCGLWAFFDPPPPDYTM